jgi:hypothetical protein
MKTLFLSLVAVLAIGTAAQAQQDACTNSYIGCVDKCVARPTQALQETCISSCQSQNNVCAGKVYGGDNMSTAKTVTPDEVAEREREEAKAAAATKAEKPVKPAGKAPRRAERKPQQ